MGHSRKPGSNFKEKAELMRESYKEQKWSHPVNGWREPIHEWAVILAGGDGTRLRELSYKVSRDRRPKQFCAFFGGKSLLAHTRERLQPLFLDENTLFVLNRAHRMYYSRELSDVPLRQKLVQPSNRGTAPAIALALLEILQRDPVATIALLPSDHYYLEPAIFRATVDRALRLAKNYENQVLIVGAPATYPEVEYGWIQPGRSVAESPSNPLHYVSRFWEKPSLVDARALQKRGCLWNTFVTIGSSSAFLKLLSASVPGLVQKLDRGMSATTLDRIYSEIEPIDFSQHILASLPDRLFVLCDGPSGWTDFGSPQRAMTVLRSLQLLVNKI